MPAARAGAGPSDPGWQKLAAQRCTPTRAELQAVSMQTAGPVSAREKEMRPAATLSVPLCALCALRPSGRARAPYSA